MTEYITHTSATTPITVATPELNGLKWWIFRIGMRKPIIKIDISTIASRMKPTLLILTPHILGNL